jgi:hypothetical protein
LHSFINEDTRRRRQFKRHRNYSGLLIDGRFFQLDSPKISTLSLGLGYAQQVKDTWLVAGCPAYKKSVCRVVIAVLLRLCKKKKKKKRRRKKTKKKDGARITGH